MLSLFVIISLYFILTSSLKNSLKPSSLRDNKVLFSTTTETNTYNLPPKLLSYVIDLKNVNDDRMRYQQLLFLASQCEKLDPSLKNDDNKVQGCLSTVHVHATYNNDNNKIFYKGDSDAQLTKGLVALLVNGLSDCTYEEIQAVKPEFIQYAGIANSLTPGRNNGFLNMLRLMKIKAKQLHDERTSSTSPSSTSSSTSNTGKSGGRIYNAILTKLSMLKPVSLELIDESYKHAGHAGMNGVSTGGETHFNVKVVAACFSGLSLVQRHKMIYTLLGSEMGSGGVHALSISAKTPEEVN